MYQVSDFVLYLGAGRFERSFSYVFGDKKYLNNGESGNPPIIYLPRIT